MASFTGQTVKSTYGFILQIPGNITGTLTTAQDGYGNSSALQLSSTTVNVNGTFTINGEPVTSGAPSTSTYIVQTADAGLPDAQVLSTLSTGIVKVTTGTGVLSSGNLSGDISTSSGGLTTTLATVNSGPGSYGSASSVATYTVNGKGLVTTSGSTSIQITESQVTGLSTSLAGLQPLSTNLTNLSSYSSNGLITYTGSNTFAASTITGTSGTITVTNGSGVSGNPTITIDPTYVGQSSITTLGTVTTGTWSGSTVAVNKGGTGITSATAYAPIIGGTTTTGALQSASTGMSNLGWVLTSTGSSSAPTWQSAGGGSGELVLISSATASSSATIDFTSLSASSYSHHLLVGCNVVPASSAIGWVRLSQAGTFKSGASDYDYCWTENTDVSGGGNVGSSAASAINCSNLNVAASNPCNFTIDLINPSNTTTVKSVLFKFMGVGAQLYSTFGQGTYVGTTSGTATAAIDGIRFMFSTGNITSGLFYLYGVKNT